MKNIIVSPSLGSLETEKCKIVRFTNLIQKLHYIFIIYWISPRFMIRRLQKNKDKLLGPSVPIPHFNKLFWFYQSDLKCLKANISQTVF